MIDPLVPPQVDLRDFPYMPIDIVRLFGSEFHARSDDGAWRAGITLWLKSYHQVPAASVPDDDVALARLAEFGRDVKSWLAVKDGALRGWVRCSDGRLYHPVVAEKALEAWLDKLGQRKSSAAGNAKRYHQIFDPAPFDAAIEQACGMLSGLNPSSRHLAKRPPVASQTRPEPSPDRTPDGTPDGTPDDLPSGSQGNLREGKGIESSSLRSDDCGASANKPKPEPKPSPKSQLVGTIGPELAAEVIEHRQRMRKPLTTEAAKRLAKQFADTGTPQEAARMMIDRAWQGFNSDWFENAKSRDGPKSAVLPFPSNRQQDFANGTDRSASSAAKQLFENIKSGRDVFK